MSFPAIEDARGVTGQLDFLEISHELRDIFKQGKGEAAFADCYVAVTPGPLIDRTKPYSVDVADIISGEPVLPDIDSG